MTYLATIIAIGCAWFAYELTTAPLVENEPIDFDADVFTGWRVEHHPTPPKATEPTERGE